MYIVLILHNNRVVSSEPFASHSDAKKSAVQLANEWHSQEGIDAFGKTELESYEEVREYFRSEAYLDSGDEISICVEEIVLKDAP